MRLKLLEHNTFFVCDVAFFAFGVIGTKDTRWLIANKSHMSWYFYGFATTIRNLANLWLCYSLCSSSKLTPKPKPRKHSAIKQPNSKIVVWCAKKPTKKGSYIIDSMLNQKIKHSSKISKHSRPLLFFMANYITAKDPSATVALSANLTSKASEYKKLIADSIKTILYHLVKSKPLNELSTLTAPCFDFFSRIIIPQGAARADNKRIVKMDKALDRVFFAGLAIAAIVVVVAIYHLSDKSQIYEASPRRLCVDGLLFFEFSRSVRSDTIVQVFLPANNKSLPPQPATCELGE